MKQVYELLEEQMNEQFIQIVLSSPKHANAPSKVKIRQVILKGELCFQIERFENNKAFHENASRQETIKKIATALEQDFKQMQLESANLQAVILNSKKGKITIKKKQKQGTDVSCLPREHNRKKHYILEEGISVPFLIDLGIQTKEGKIVHSKYDKFRQMNRFLEFIRDILPYLPKERKASIIDFGCGKSYLTFAMYYYLTVLNNYDVEIIGLDLKEDVIKTCNTLKDRYGYENLVFLQGDISQYNEKQEVDMVVTLHACDIATDYALHKALLWNAKVILSVPCCQHELNNQIESEVLAPALKYGIIKERMSALLTDAIRANLLEEAGYDAQILEFIDMEHTPKNILIRAVRKQGFQKRGVSIQREELEGFLKELNAEMTLEKLLRESKLISSK